MSTPPMSIKIALPGTPGPVTAMPQALTAAWRYLADTVASGGLDFRARCVFLLVMAWAQEGRHPV